MSRHLITRGLRGFCLASSALMAACGGGGGGAGVDSAPALAVLAKKQGGGQACGRTSTLTRVDGDQPLLARFGSVFSTTMYDPSITSGNTTHNPTPAVVQASTDGVPAVGCAVTWEANTDAGNGWVFPLDAITDETGRARAYWIAGDGSSQTLTARLRTSGAAATIAGNAQPHNTRSNSIWMNWSSPAWESFSVDVTPLSFPSSTYYSAVNFKGGYTGIQSTELLFSVWDANGAGAELIRSAPGVTCSHFAGEGTGIKCEQPFTPQVGHRYRFTVSVSFPDGQHTDYTMRFTDIDGDGIEREYAALRYADHVTDEGAAAFVEDFSEGSASCLSTAARTVLLGNVRYRTSSSAKWISVRSGVPAPNYSQNTNEICANYLYSTQKGQFKLSTGGTELVGPPMNLSALAAPALLQAE